MSGFFGGLLVIIYYFPHTIGETGIWFLSIFHDKYKDRFSIIKKFNDNIKMNR